jgi:sugar diacid utilization regulator
MPLSLDMSTVHIPQYVKVIICSCDVERIHEKTEGAFMIFITIWINL